MTTTTNRNRYSALSISAHWLTALLIIAVYCLIEFRDIFPRGSDGREAMKMWHIMLGLVIFGLVFVRLAALAVYRIPPIMPTPPAWQHILAKWMHFALWLFLIAMPVLGWLTLSAQGKPVPFFGLELPALLAPDKALGHQLEEIHETIGTIGYWLIGLHVVAALYHHHFMRDDTLLRMLPQRAG
ncbi:MAG: cytochrome b [Proteobacteria bacterium]|nr:cytochrome b [Pseudomonadota bacterium]